MGDAFTDTYSAVCTWIVESLSSQDRDVPLMERPELAALGFLALPVNALLAVPSDADFIDAVYVKLLDRGPDDEERDEHLVELSRGLPRRALIDGVMQRPAFLERAVPVELVDA